MVGALVACMAVVAGFHGNDRVRWVILGGPLPFLAEAFARSDRSYLMVMFFGGPIVWGVYGVMITSPRRGMQRVLAVFGVTLFHAACVGGFFAFIWASGRWEEMF